jgi:uncharacterized protein YdhG (YjbR/CyaY superfamily)
MARTDFRSVDEYIASQPEAVQGILERVWGIIRKAVLDAEEVISYKIPMYKLLGGPVLYFGGWRRHYSLYPANDRLVAAFKNDLAPYEVKKGTIRFPLSEPVPLKFDRTHREVSREGNRRAPEGEDDRPECVWRIGDEIQAGT